MDSNPQLPARKGLRGDVLGELKRAQPLTAKELADKLGVSANAIRHHLKELEAAAFIVYGREQRGVGAPTFAYRLSPAGEALFPRAYEATLNELLDRMAEKSGRGAAVDLLADHYHELTRRVLAQLDGRSASERVALVARLMSEQGYMAEWQEAAGAFRLAEHNCAIRAVAERLPRSSNSSVTCWGPRSSGAPTSRAAATRASTRLPSPPGRLRSRHEQRHRSPGPAALQVRVRHRHRSRCRAARPE